VNPAMCFVVVSVYDIPNIEVYHTSYVPYHQIILAYIVVE